MGSDQDMAFPLEAVQHAEGEDRYAPGADQLSPLLEWLDRLLARAAAKAETLYGAQAAADPYRGLYVNYAEVNRLLDQFAGSPVFGSDEDLEWKTLQLEFDLAANFLMDQLAQHFKLSSFDLKIILLALAPEVDLRYERLFAYLQDDVTRRHPSVDLALNLFCQTNEDKLVRRAHFAPESALLRHDLIQLLTDTSRPSPALLGHYFKLDEQITNFLLNQRTIGEGLASFCEVREPRSSTDFIGVSPEVRKALRFTALQARDTRPLRFFLSGPCSVDKLHVAEMLSTETELPLLVVDLYRAVAGDTDLGRLLARVFRHARIVGALVYLEGCDVLHSEGGAVYARRLCDAVRDFDGILLLAGEESSAPLQAGELDLLEIAFPIPEFSLRRSCWRHNLAAANLQIEEDDLDLLAGRFRLTPAQVAQTVAHARNQSRWRAATVSETGEASQLNLVAICESARTQSQHQLGSLAQKIEPVYDWDDIVVPDEVHAQLRELCSRVAERQRVLHEWGFGRKLSLGRGVTALFAGPSGTGKTMAAEIVANELQLELYKIDLSRIVSKYIGETEKNLDRIFSTAENANAILFFDEADALFGKRSEVRDSHDRYANIEVSYLLQKMEQYEGVAILATNLRQNLDEAFLRRLQLVVQFSIPDEGQRRQIWKQLFPAESPRDENIDFDALARQFRVAGANIKNIVLGSAFLAAANGGRIEMTHVMKSAQSEYQKLGKVFSD